MSDVELNCGEEKKQSEGLNCGKNLGYYKVTLWTSVGTDCKQYGAQMGGGQFPQSVHVI